MILKSYIVEKNLRILDNYKAVLLYGENNGIKDDIRLALKNANKETEIINFFEDEILKNKNILYENISNGSFYFKKSNFYIRWD